MKFEIKLKHFFSPVAVILVSLAFFSIPSFLQNPASNENIHDPLLWILTAYWGISLSIYKFGGLNKKKNKQ